jgi:hypothetical protein
MRPVKRCRGGPRPHPPDARLPGARLAVDAQRLNAALVHVRARPGDTATDAALAEGEALSLPASLAVARRALAAAQPAPPRQPDAAGCPKGR